MCCRGLEAYIQQSRINAILPDAPLALRPVRPDWPLQAQACHLDCLLALIRVARTPQATRSSIRDNTSHTVTHLHVNLSLSVYFCPAAHHQESKRLKKMAEDKSVAATKRDTFEWRLNVLSSFTRKNVKDAAEKKSEL